MKFQQTLEVLGSIADSFSTGSAERDALENACRAILFVERERIRDEFERFLSESDRPLRGIEIIQLKAYGLSLPAEQRTPAILELEQEIDALVAKLQKAARERGKSGITR